MRVFLLLWLSVWMMACSPTPEPAAAGSVIHATNDSKLIDPLTTVLDASTIELGDTRADITLSTSAQSDDDGAHWDDSQNWRLTLHVNGQDFALFDDFLGIAQPHYWVSLLDNELTVMLLISGSAQFELIRFDYSSNDSSVHKQPLVATDANWNLLHQSHYQ